MHYCESDDEPVACADCDWTGKAEELNDIRNLGARVCAGEEMPAGECPVCGALAHLVEKAEA